MTKQPKRPSAGKSAATLAKILAQSTGAKQLRGEISSNDEGKAQSIASMSKRIIEALSTPSTTNTATAARLVKPESRASLILKRHAEGSPSSSNLPKPRAPVEIQTTADLGQLIRRAREDKGLTQQEFADLTGVGRRFISELENGKPTIELGKALKVALGAGISIHGRQR